MDIEIIIKYIDGSANEEEKELLEQWLSEDLKNKNHFESVKEALESHEDFKFFHKLDVDKDWALVEGKINDLSDNKKKSLSISPFVKVSLQVAAIIAIAFVINILFFYEAPNQEVPDVAYNEIYVPKGQRSEITLTDGTKVIINAETRLKLPNVFNEGSRDIWLEGEAFFDVAKNPDKPFFVHTAGVDVQVFGTSFNVRAYAEEDLIETTLVEGSVALRKVGDNGKLDKEVVKLEPNHKAVFFKSKDAHVTERLINEMNKPLEIKKILLSEPVDPLITSSWTIGKLIFENEKFVNIIPQLERYYGVTIEVKDEELNNVRYTGTIKNVSVEQTIKALQITNPFDFEINDDYILITSKNNAAYGK